MSLPIEDKRELRLQLADWIESNGWGTVKKDTVTVLRSGLMTCKDSIDEVKDDDNNCGRQYVNRDLVVYSSLNLQVLHIKDVDEGKFIMNIVDAMRGVDPQIAYCSVRIKWNLFAVERGPNDTRSPASNQGTKPAAGMKWNGLNFASGTEIAIARELEKYGVLFLPNCMMRFNGTFPDDESQAPDRSNFERDLLVCSNGKWGIL